MVVNVRKTRVFVVSAALVLVAFLATVIHAAYAFTYDPECNIEMVLVGESYGRGELVRVFKVTNDCGTGLQTQLQHLSGARGNTAYEAKMNLIAEGKGRFLTLSPYTTVSKQVLRQWEAEGYDPVWELKDGAKKEGDVVSPFSDIRGHWAYDAIVQMYEAGIVGGYPDGLFRPDNPVTRAEYIAMMRRIAGEIRQGNTGFADITGHWAHTEIVSAEEHGWLVADEYPARQLRPNDPMHRQEMARLVARAAGLENHVQSSTATETTFTDNHAIGRDFRPYVAALADRGLIGGYPDGTFGPTRTLTRAEAVVMLVRLLNVLGEGRQGGQ